MIKINEAADNSVDYKELVKTADELSRKYPDLEIFETPKGINNFAGFGINWSAKGTVSLEDAKVFLNQLKSAINEIEKLHKKYKPGSKYRF